jgi:hypothetical protein
MAEWFEKQTLGTLLDEAALRWGSREPLYHEGRSAGALQSSRKR